MDAKAFRFWMRLRTRDLVVGFMVYIFGSVLLVLALTLGAPVIQQLDAVRIAFVIVALVLGIMSWLWIDGCIVDVKALTRDVPEDEQDSNIVGEFTKSPFAFFRVLIFVLVLASTAGLIYAAFS
jgi:sterol desaturase/sphingolipid hydroxylase (fatty acid hydroxylase superfamily)